MRGWGGDFPGYRKDGPKSLVEMLVHLLKHTTFLPVWWPHPRTCHACGSPFPWAEGRLVFLVLLLFSFFLSVFLVFMEIVAVCDFPPWAPWGRRWQAGKGCPTGTAPSLLPPALAACIASSPWLCPGEGNPLERGSPSAGEDVWFWQEAGSCTAIHRQASPACRVWWQCRTDRHSLGDPAESWFCWGQSHLRIESF